MTSSERLSIMLDLIRSNKHPTMIIFYISNEIDGDVVHSHPIIRDSDKLGDLLLSIMDKKDFMCFASDPEGIKWFEDHNDELITELKSYARV